MVKNPIHQKYRGLELLADSKVENLDDILPEMQKHWPGAFLENNAGPERSFFDTHTHLLIGYAWYKHRLGVGKWNYLIFKTPQKW